MRIYIAGPYTKPDPCINVNIAIDAANKVMDLGHEPFVPHLSHFWHTMTPRPYSDWMRHDLAFLPTCGALIRLPGESPGADIEVQIANELGMHVYQGVEDFVIHNG